ncbi:MAG: choice-of-anchor L domain-containing protein [Acidobacteriota bacterium]
MKVKKFSIILSVTLVCTFGLALQAEAQITGTSSDDAVALVGQLLAVSGGATTTNETVTPGACSGTFTGGLAVGPNFLIDSGIILSSGDVAGIAAPNAFDDTTLDLGLGGDPFLNALVPGFTTYDACVLEFDFACPVGSAGSNLAFNYNFASEEYNEWVNSAYNDVFGFQLNGSNIALLPDGVTPVAINNVNNGLNDSVYNDNDYGDFGGSPPFAIEADGYVSTLTAVGSAGLATNHIKLAIGDAGDHILDSWVMVEGGSFECIVQLRIDVKPGSNPNCINVNPHGVVSVAFFGSYDVDITTIDQGSFTYAGAPVLRCATEDSDLDGIDDLVCKFSKAAMTDLPQPGDDCVFLPVSGTFIDGLKWEGLDHVCVPGDPTCASSTPVATP